MLHVFSTKCWISLKSAQGCAVPFAHSLRERLCKLTNRTAHTTDVPFSQGPMGEHKSISGTGRTGKTGTFREGQHAGFQTSP